MGERTSFIRSSEAFCYVLSELNSVIEEIQRFLNNQSPVNIDIDLKKYQYHVACLVDHVPRVPSSLTLFKEGRKGVKWELGFAFFGGWEMGFCALGLGFMKQKQ